MYQKNAFTPHAVLVNRINISTPDGVIGYENGTNEAFTLSSCSIVQEELSYEYSTLEYLRVHLTVIEVAHGRVSLKVIT